MLSVLGIAASISTTDCSFLFVFQLRRLNQVTNSCITRFHQRLLYLRQRCLSFHFLQQPFPEIVSLTTHARYQPRANRPNQTATVQYLPTQAPILTGPKALRASHFPISHPNTNPENPEPKPTLTATSSQVPRHACRLRVSERPPSTTAHTRPPPSSLSLQRDSVYSSPCPRSRDGSVCQALSGGTVKVALIASHRQGSWPFGSVPLQMAFIPCSKTSVYTV